jgi:nicotinate phosphoribosyltransferase
MASDALSVENDDQPGEPLIHQVMQAGKRLGPQPTFSEIRARAARELELLPEPLRKLEPGATYPVEVGEALIDLAAEFDRHLMDRDRKR